MKVAVCFSGQLGPLDRCYPNQKQSFVDENNCDIFVQTSDAVSQKINCSPNPEWSKHMIDSREYLKNNGEDNWRKGYGTYGIIYNVPNDIVEQKIKQVYHDNLKSFKIEHEPVSKADEELEMTKWEWLRAKQFKKMFDCNRLMHDYEKENNVKYDFVIRSRCDIVFARRFNIEEIVSKYDNVDNKIFVLGGWESYEKDRFMDGYMCDGFVFGRPEVIDVYAGIYENEDPYPPNPKYVDYYNRMGDNAEYQVQQHLINNGIEICYINDPQHQLSDRRCGRWLYNIVR